MSTSACALAFCTWCLIFSGTERTLLRLRHTGEINTWTVLVTYRRGNRILLGILNGMNAIIRSKIESIIFSIRRGITQVALSSTIYQLWPPLVLLSFAVTVKNTAIAIPTLQKATKQYKTLWTYNSEKKKAGV